jgi:hypothetical protein
MKKYQFRMSQNFYLGAKILTLQHGSGNHDEQLTGEKRWHRNAVSSTNRVTWEILGDQI